jgi:hypothetical protein
MNAFMRRSLRLMLMASLGFFQTLVHTYAADAPTMLNCPGTRSDLSLDTGDWVILGDCEMGNVNLSGSAHLFFLPTTADQSKLVRSRVTLAGHTALKDSSVILFNSVDITFPQTFINEFWLEARDQSRVMVAQSTVLTMDKADAPTQSMFWRFFDDSKLAVMGSSRLVNSWLMLSLFNRAFAIYEDSTNFFMEVYIPGDSPTTFIANRGSITKLWLPFTEAGAYTLVPDQDIAIVKPTMRVGITNMKYDIGVILQALNGTKPPAIRFRANSHFSLNLGLAGDQGGPVTLDGLKIHRRDSDEYLPAPFEKVLFEAGTYVDTIDVYVVSVRYPIPLSTRSALMTVEALATIPIPVIRVARLSSTTRRSVGQIPQPPGQVPSEGSG